MNSFPVGSLYTVSLDTNPQGATTNVLTNADLLSATVKRILYRKPNGAKGYFEPATINGTRLEYDFQTTAQTPVGDWCFEPYVEIAGETFVGQTDSVRFESSLL